MLNNYTTKHQKNKYLQNIIHASHILPYPILLNAKCFILCIQCLFHFICIAWPWDSYLLYLYFQWDISRKNAKLTGV